MTPNEIQNSLNKAKEFFRKNIMQKHYNDLRIKHNKLSNYNINPFILKYLSQFIFGNTNSVSIAKALILPRIMGTSINTMFGNSFQKMITEIFDGIGSAVSGIDIEFIDRTDGRKKYCQLKGGPNTINKDDITTITNHFNGVKNLARTNNLDIGLNDLIVGVLYGKEKELSAHYKKINESYPVIIGEDFWHKLTGDIQYYEKLQNAIGSVASDLESQKEISLAIEDLSKEIDEFI